MGRPSVQQRPAAMPCSPAMFLRAITPGVTLGASQELHPGISMHLIEPHVQCRFVTCNCDSVCDSVRHLRLLGLSCINCDLNHSKLTILRCAVVLELYGGMFCALLSVVGRPVPSLALLLNNYPRSRSCCTAEQFMCMEMVTTLPRRRVGLKQAYALVSEQLSTNRSSLRLCISVDAIDKMQW